MAMSKENSLYIPEDMSTQEEAIEYFGSKSMYNQAIENADGVPYQLIFGRDVGKGRYLTIGKGIQQLIGVDPEEFTEELFTGLIEKIIPLSDNHESDQAELREKFLSGKLKHYKAEILIRLPGGGSKWILDTALPLLNSKTGRITGAYGIIFDINERKMTLNALERSLKLVEQSDNLKNAFLRNLSHEIRTPLNAIVGFSTLLNEPENTEPERQEITGILMRNSDHLLEMFNNIIEISKIEANTVKIKKSLINLTDLLLRIYDRFRNEATARGIQLKFSNQKVNENVYMFGDSFKLFQTLSYLIDNAIKFTEKGEVEFGYSIFAETIRFKVADTGTGITDEHQSDIFGRFFQAESSSTRRYGGTGLGLAISKAYVELMGGKIWFTSQPGEGSVFYFELPFVQK